MRRKYGTMILAMAIMFLSSFQVVRASADLIWEPSGDNFYITHRGACQHVGRSYIANGPNGELVVYKSPEDPEIVTKIPNGTTVGGSYIYQDKDGITWAVYNDFKTDVSGWVPYDYLVLRYDYISFEEAYREEIVSETGQLDSELREQEFYKWSYPGSPESSKMRFVSESDTPKYSASYTDEYGRKWVYGTYFKGHKNYWICLDAPTDDYATLYPEGSAIAKMLETIPIEEAVAGIVPKGEAAEEIAQEEAMEKNSPVEETTEEIVPGGEKAVHTMIWLGVLIAAVVAVSLVLLGRLKKK